MCVCVRESVCVCVRKMRANVMQPDQTAYYYYYFYFFYDPHSSGIASCVCWDRWNNDVTPTLDAALLSSSRACADLGRESGLRHHINTTQK